MGTEYAKAAILTHVIFWIVELAGTAYISSFISIVFTEERGMKTPKSRHKQPLLSHLQCLKASIDLLKKKKSNLFLPNLVIFIDNLFQQ